MLNQFVIAADILAREDTDPEVITNDVRAFLEEKYGRTCLPKVTVMKTSYRTEEGKDD